MSALPIPAELPPAGLNAELRYDWDSRYLQSLGGDLLRGAQPRKLGQFACYLIPGSDEHSNLGRAVELPVLYKKFGNTEPVLRKEYGPYEDQSDFVVVLDRQSALPAGALRMISNGPAGIKTLNDIAKPPLGIPTAKFQSDYGIENLDTVQDDGTVAVLPEYRRAQNHLVSTMLYRASHLFALREGRKHYVSVIDAPVYGMFRTIGLSFEPIKGSKPFEYIDSKESIAVHGDVPNFIGNMEDHYRTVLRHQPWKAPFMHRYIARLAHGVGVDKMLMFEH